MIAVSAAVSPEMVKSYAAAFEAGGCDEIIFVPTASRLDQVSLLATRLPDFTGSRAGVGC